MAYYNTYSGLGVTLTKEQERQYNTAYGIAYSYNLTAPRMEDFAAGNGEAIIDYYAQQAYAKSPNAQNPYTGDVKKRLAEIAARKPAKTWKDYLLWIALGGVVAFGAYKMLTGKKKRR